MILLSGFFFFDVITFDIPTDETEILCLFCVSYFLLGPTLYLNIAREKKKFKFKRELTL